jgi:hypothetical protein
MPPTGSAKYGAIGHETIEIGRICGLVEGGRAQSAPGVGAKYEPPLKPEATTDTTNTSPQEAAQEVLDQLQDAGVIRFDLSSSDTKENS